MEKPPAFCHISSDGISNMFRIFAAMTSNVIYIVTRPGPVGLSRQHSTPILGNVLSGCMLWANERNGSRMPWKQRYYYLEIDIISRINYETTSEISITHPIKTSQGDPYWYSTKTLTPDELKETKKTIAIRYRKLEVTSQGVHLSRAQHIQIKLQTGKYFSSTLIF